MRATLGRLRRGPVVEVPLCFVVLVLVEIGLRLLSLPRVAGAVGVAMSEAEQPVAPPAALPSWAAPRLLAAQRVAERWPVGPEGKCLRRALLAGQRLRALRPELVLGVRREGTALGIHAWLVVCGGALDPAAATYRQLHPRSATKESTS